MPSSALLIKLYVLVGFGVERPNRRTPKSPEQIWIPQVQEEEGCQAKLPNDEWQGPISGLSTLGCYRDLYFPSSALLIKLYILVRFGFERPNRRTPKSPEQIWIPQVQEEEGCQAKLPNDVDRRSEEGFGG